MRAAAAIPVLLLAASLGAQVADSPRDVALRTFVLQSVPQLPTLIRQRIAEDIKSRKYHRTDPKEIADRVRDALQRRGYFKATIDDPKITAVRQDAHQEVVDVAVSASLGAQYRLNGISFTGAKAFSSDELRRQFSFKPGDIFDVEQVRKGITSLRRLYCAKGYVDLTPVPNAEVDDAHHLIALSFDMDEGPLYHYGYRIAARRTQPAPGRVEILRGQDLLLWLPRTLPAGYSRAPRSQA